MNNLNSTYEVILYEKERLLQLIDSHFDIIQNRSIFREFEQNFFDKNFLMEVLLSDLNIEQNSLIFIHAGLKKLHYKTKFSYLKLTEQIIKILNNSYKPNAIICPSFTPSFIKTGIFSVNYSKSEVGIFSELFRKKAGYRTEDALHSVSIVSNNLEKFKELNYDDTFGEDGLYAFLKNNKTYILNISTHNLIATQLHYIEQKLSLPYKVEGIKYKGIIYDSNDNIKNKNQINHKNKTGELIDKNKVLKYLIKSEKIHIKEYKDILISSIKCNDLFNVLSPKLKREPYFLVSYK